ncbi:MAG: CoB--CoM heterodisulfide reductase iron-sulfur subunit A family protein [Deltaproteobacteria bacterium]|nr:CoB--CoM heterodisulfide reductase iron-sulfur subunit A family protein [Deltaproteobacteria bacterium]
MNPDVEIYILYRDIRTYGFREDIYNEAREKGIIFIRYDLDRKPQVEEELESHGLPRLKVTVKDILLNEDLVLHPDFISLATAIVPNDQKELASIFKVPLNKDGFFVEAHMKLRPVDFASEGIFVCGMAHYPKPIEESIAQAQAAAARASTILSKEYIEAEGMVAAVDEELCSTCFTCVKVCPYKVPHMNERGRAEIEPMQCQGCGICVAECPADAIEFKYISDKQIMASCEALLAS